METQWGIQVVWQDGFKQIIPAPSEQAAHDVLPLFKEDGLLVSVVHRVVPEWEK